MGSRVMPEIIRIGIIDSGLDTESHIRHSGYRDFTTQGGSDLIGHGTAVAAVIAQNCTAVEFYIARVFAEKPVCSAARVAQALQWLTECSVDLVNMSFGLSTDRSALADSCQQAITQGCLLVAASPARGNAVYPASYPGVIRATGDARCAPGELSALHTVQADYGGCVRYPGIKVAGASIGCASVSGIIAAQLVTGRGGSLNDKLHRRALYHGPEDRSGGSHHPEAVSR